MRLNAIASRFTVTELHDELTLYTLYTHVSARTGISGFTSACDMLRERVVCAARCTIAVSLQPPFHAMPRCLPAKLTQAFVFLACMPQLPAHTPTPPRRALSVPPHTPNRHLEHPDTGSLGAGAVRQRTNAGRGVTGRSRALDGPVT
jgi:hypothetical protein